ncbi:MAG: hypothetical protein U0451_02300 [Candidatus Saccharimonadales bacterium]
MREEIKTSTTQTAYEMIAVGVIGLLILVFASNIMSALNDLIPLDLTRLTNIFRLIIIIATLWGVYITRRNDRLYKYYMTDDSIIISKKRLGRLSEDTYSAKNITSISVRQSRFGVNGNYGTLIINSDKLYDNQSIQLRNVVNPRQVADRVNEFIIHGNKK